MTQQERTKSYRIDMRGEVSTRKAGGRGKLKDQNFRPA